MKKIIALVFIFILSLAASTKAQPTFTSAGTIAQTTSSTTVTCSYTLTSGDDLFVITEVGAATTPTINSVTWNGSENLTIIGSMVVNTSFRTVSLYRLAGGTSGTHDAVVTTAASTSLSSCFAFGYDNVDSLGTPGSTTGGGTAWTVSADNSSGNLLLAACSDNELTMGSVSFTNGTERSEQVSANTALWIGDRSTAGTPVTIDGTMTSVFSAYSCIAVSLIPPSASSHNPRSRSTVGFGR